MKKAFLDADKVVDYLVACYREQLEDDGDLIASEFQENINNLAKCAYEDGRDVILMEGDIIAVNEILPSRLTNDFEDQLEE